MGFIYKILNTKTGDFYIGSTHNVVIRVRAHFSLLNRKRHTAKEFQRQFDLHGVDAFNVEVIEEITEGNFRMREKEIIRELNPRLNSSRENPLAIKHNDKLKVGKKYPASALMDVDTSKITRGERSVKKMYA